MVTIVLINKEILSFKTTNEKEANIEILLMKTKGLVDLITDH
jgi:hypothetical protein